MLDALVVVAVMEELRAAREHGEAMSRKLNQDVEDRLAELQDARDTVAGLEARLVEARAQEQDTATRSGQHEIVGAQTGGGVGRRKEKSQGPESCFQDAKRRVGKLTRPEKSKLISNVLRARCFRCLSPSSLCVFEKP